MTRRTQKDDLVSVIVPNFNYGQYLKRCIESILNQSYKPIEVIIVDDGSTDKSLKVIGSFGNRVRLIKQSNLGVNRARNLGLLNSKGSIIALCDSDDFWEPSKVRKQVSFLLQNPSFVLVGSSIRYFQNDNDEVQQVHVAEQGNLSKFYKIKPGVAWIPNAPSSSLFYKAAALSIGLFDETLTGNAEDWEFYARLSSCGNFASINEPLVNVRVHSLSRSQVKISKWYFDNRRALSVLYSKGLFEGKLEFFRGRLHLDYSMLKTLLKNFKLTELMTCLRILFSGT